MTFLNNNNNKNNNNKKIITIIIIIIIIVAEKNNLRKKGKRYILKPDPANETNLILFRVKIKNGVSTHLQVVRADEQDALYDVIHTASKHAG